MCGGLYNLLRYTELLIHKSNMQPRILIYFFTSRFNCQGVNISSVLGFGNVKYSH